jgi:hypothetical protein
MAFFFRLETADGTAGRAADTDEHDPFRQTGRFFGRFLAASARQSAQYLPG